jgi:hypothetical protein
VLEKSLVVELGCTFFALFFMLHPMIPLTLGVAILDEHTRLTRL